MARKPQTDSATADTAEAQNHEQDLTESQEETTAEVSADEETTAAPSEEGNQTAGVASDEEPPVLAESPSDVEAGGEVEDSESISSTKGTRDFDVVTPAASRQMGPRKGRTPELQTTETARTRIRKWLGGTTQLGARHSVMPVESAELSEPKPLAADQQSELTPAAARKELRTLKSSRRSWTAVVKEAEASAEKIQEEITANTRAVQTISDWVGRFDRSYQWKLQQTLDRQLGQARSDLAAYEASAKNVQEFEPGRLVRLRKQFHRAVGYPLVWAIPLAALVVLLPILFRIPKLESLQTFYDPNLSAPIIILSVIAVVGTVLLVRRGLGRDTVKNTTIAKWIFVAIAVGILIVLLPSLEDMVRQIVIPFLEENWLIILSSLFLVLAVWTTIALAVYHRGWSTYRREVATQLAKLKAVIDGYVESQQEVLRLELLHQQTGEWLRILAHALYRPWATDPEWEASKARESHFEDFPFALRVAEVEDQIGPKSAELERIIASKLLVQGWRADAFKDLVNAVGGELGLARDAFSVESLDKDLPHQTNNTRNIMRTTLESGAKNNIGTPESDQESPRYLVEVARSRLMELIEQTQAVALSAARPNVRQIVNDPLESLALDSGVSIRGKESQNWDGFLKESLGAGEIVQPPLSILNFTPEGQMEKAGETPTTFVLIPQRLAEAIPESAQKGIQLVPVSDNSSRPVEIIARIDVTEAIGASRVRLLSHAGAVGKKHRANGETAAAAQTLCSTCADPTCPASEDPKRPCVNSEW
jgi:hypothetical protein